MKQSGLNGAYYGPSIPPQTSRSVGRSSGCGPCCLLCTLIKFIFSIIIIISIAVLVLWLVFRPHRLDVHVDSATLSQFNLPTSTNKLQYNLSLDVSVRNRNKRIGLDYKYIEADAYYDGNRFGFQQLPSFYQGHKNTTMLYPSFEGTGLLDGGQATYRREKGEGYFYIDVKLYTKLKLKVWGFKLHRIKREIDCRLKFPAPGTNGAAFERTKCDVHYLSERKRW